MFPGIFRAKEKPTEKPVETPKETPKILTPSQEQQAIIDAVVAGENVIVDAVAGSGKTSSILFLAPALPKKRIVVVTYNSRLKTETRERVLAAGIRNMEVHTYHSLGRKYVDPCFTDTELITITKKNLRPQGSFAADVFVLDEVQDMTRVYYDFIVKAICDSGAKQLVVLGDHLQCIYDFPQKGADARFLTLADKIFNVNKNTWKKLFLNTSYRITKQMEYFVNECVLGYPRMKAEGKGSEPVRYIIGDPFEKVPEYICNEIQLLLNCGAAMPEDIFVLAPSIRSVKEKHPVNMLENLLVKKYGIPCYVPTSDDDTLKDKIMKGKVVFSSFHQSKGLERKIVFVMSFSMSFYFSFSDAPKDVCPPVLYVAATRAMKSLYVCGEGAQTGPLPFLKYGALANKNVEKVIVSLQKKGDTPPASPPGDKERPRRVTDLIRFLPEQVLMTIIDLCKMKIIRAPYTNIKIDATVETEGGRSESVSDLNGIAIPTVYEHRLTGSISIQKRVEDWLGDLNKGDILDKTIRQQAAAVVKEPKKPSDYLLLANIYSAHISGYLFKIKQIKKYDWLPSKTMEALLDILTNTISSKKVEFEKELRLEFYSWRKKTLQIFGQADLVDADTLWELKCVDSLKPEHAVQLALYAWLWHKLEYNVNGRRRFCLHNIRTGEVQELTGVENLEYIAECVLDNHFRIGTKIGDDEFISASASASASAPASSSQRCLLIND